MGLVVHDQIWSRLFDLTNSLFSIYDYIPCFIISTQANTLSVEPSPQKLRQKSGVILILGVTDNFDNNENAVDVK